MADDNNNDSLLSPAEARAKAEARRRKILEKSNQRMDLVSGENGIPEPDAELELSGAARLQAMRRRRFKKSGNKEESEETPSNPMTQETDDEVPETPKEEPQSMAMQEEAVEETPGTETKKYKGVAAVRRQKAKQRAEAAAAATESSDQVTLPELKRLPINKLPIFMHILTILVLFVSGLQIGLNQPVHETVAVHRTLVVPQEHGIGITTIFGGGKKGSNDAKALLQEELSVLDHDHIAGDEFAQKDRVDDNESEPNIDPLFGVDLDLYTRGDGILMVFGRFAVSLHRINLQIFYYLPMAIVGALISLPRKLLQTPPILFLLALMIRQVGKRVLGAGLPEPDDKSSAKEDVLAMLKQGVMNFLASSFPNTVELYDAFTHLRADMFVILCGLFVGLAWSHHFDGSSALVHDEL
jgi:hypothetical protein